MWTSSGQGACRMRFFYIFDGPLAKVGSSSRLQVYVWYARKDAPEGSPILDVKLNAQVGDLQQRWNGAVASFASPAADQPFQFVFIGQLADTNFTALAVDDLTADPNCLPSSATRLPKTTTTTAVVVQTTMTTKSSNVVFPTTTTAKIPLDKREPGKGPLGKCSFECYCSCCCLMFDFVFPKKTATKIAIGIIVPVLVIAAIAFGYYAFRRHQLSKRGAEGEVLSMKGLQSRHED